MKDLKLVHPNTLHMDSYLDMCCEFKAHNITTYKMWDDPDKIQTDADRRALVQRYKNMREGVNLPDGWVPGSSMWLLDGDEVVGSCSIRHHLNEFLSRYIGHIGYGIRPSVWGRGYGNEQLRLALIEAKRLGIDKVLISCNVDNEGSRKIIEANGGTFDRLVDGDANDPPQKRRYWIDNA